MADESIVVGGVVAIKNLTDERIMQLAVLAEHWPVGRNVQLFGFPPESCPRMIVQGVRWEARTDKPAIDVCWFNVKDEIQVSLFQPDMLETIVPHDEDEEPA